MEAYQVAENLWKYCKKRWPRYNESGTLKQGDAAEFLLKLLTAEKDTESQVETLTAQVITCSNDQCTLRRQEHLVQEHINLINLTTNKEVSLQQIADKIAYRNRSINCVKCNKKGTDTKVILKAPEYLIFQVTRKSQQMNEIRSRTATIEINEN